MEDMKNPTDDAKALAAIAREVEARNAAKCIEGLRALQAACNSNDDVAAAIELEQLKAMPTVEEQQAAALEQFNRVRAARERHTAETAAHAEALAAVASPAGTRRGRELAEIVDGLPDGKVTAREAVAKRHPLFHQATDAQLENRYRYHAPQPGQAERYEAIRGRVLDLAKFVRDNTPVSPEQSRAYNALDEVTFPANAATARNA